MTLEAMQERLQLLIQRKTQLENELNTAQTNLVMIQGNINELHFHIQSLAMPQKQQESVFEPATTEEGE